ncbi:hypothetical protein M758_12G003100 [Ceratodon purpureus]|nr:hypothetical protein M758_12G003100 [Ceratodon purpureus]
MELRLSGVSSSSACSTPQAECSSSGSGSSTAPSSSAPTSFSLRPSAFVAALVASSSSLVASVPPSLALKYDDFVRKADSVKSAASTSSADGSSFVDFVSANPVAVVAGVAAVAVPLIAFRASAGQSFGSVSAAAAFAKLSEQNAQLLDIRAPEDIKADGRPDLKLLRKKALQIAYVAEDKSMFLNRVVAKCRNAETTTLFVLDRLDGNSLAVAKLLASNGFQRVYAVKGGVEGTNGWQKSELPWVLPRKGFSLNLDGLKNLLAGSQSNANLGPTLGAAAAAGIGVAVFTEAETVLQLLGSAAFIQIFAKKFMFADDREKTVKEIQTFLDTKIAPQEFVEELKEIGRVLLPKDDGVDAAVVSGSAAIEKKVKKVDSVAPVNGAQIRDAGAA